MQYRHKNQTNLSCVSHSNMVTNSVIRCYLPRSQQKTFRILSIHCHTNNAIQLLASNGKTAKLSKRSDTCSRFEPCVALTGTILQSLHYFSQQANQYKRTLPLDEVRSIYTNSLDSVFSQINFSSLK